PDGRHMLSAGVDGTVRLWGPGNRVRLFRDGAAVNSAAFSRNGARLITGGADGTARVPRLSDGRVLAEVRPGAPLSVARLAAVGRLAVTAGRDGRLRVWRVATQTVVREYKLNGPIKDGELSRDGRRVVAASADGTAAVFGVTRTSEVVLRGHTDEVV